MVRNLAKRESNLAIGASGNDAPFIADFIKNSTPFRACGKHVFAGSGSATHGKCHGKPIANSMANR